MVEIEWGNTTVVMFGNEVVTTEQDITVMVWEDLDLDGIMEEGEEILNGWEVSLYDSEMILLDLGITTREGINFTVNASGTYHLLLSSQEGWLYVTPEMVTIEVPNSITAGFGMARHCEIHVFKFHDINMDAIHDADESPISGWEMFIKGPFGQIDSLTEDDGWVNITGLMPGEYTVSEGNRDMWFPTGPDSKMVVLDRSGHIVEVMFGNARMGTIEVTKFNDMNMNGLHDEEEPGIPGWIISLYQDGEMIDFRTTGEEGRTGFDVIPGTYTVRELSKNGWFTTTGIEHEVTLGEGETLSTEFGNTQYSSVEGLAFHDENGDGERQDGESVLQGWTLTLRSEGDTLEKITDPSGSVMFPYLTPEEYTLTIESREG
jgi:hypothetical protein